MTEKITNPGRIVFPASVNQVRTLADGGIRAMLDLPEDCIAQMAMLAECKRQGLYLEVSIVAIDPPKYEPKRNE
jgi:hypothetical protein